MLSSSSPDEEKLAMDEFRLNQQKQPQKLQHSLLVKAFQSAKHAQLHSFSHKKELIIAIFLYHA